MSLADVILEEIGKVAFFYEQKIKIKEFHPPLAGVGIWK